MVEHVDALVADWAVLRSLRRDGDVAQVAPTILDHVKVLRPVQLGNRFLGRDPAKVWIGGIEEKSAEVDDDVDGVEEGVKDVERCLNKKLQKSFVTVDLLLFKEIFKCEIWNILTYG